MFHLTNLLPQAEFYIEGRKAFTRACVVCGHDARGHDSVGLNFIKTKIKAILSNGLSLGMPDKAGECHA
jgi:hypothetical protein